MSIVISVLVLLCDQFIKTLIRGYPVGERLFALPPLVEVVHCTNTGAAFSILRGNTGLIVLFSILLLIVIAICLTCFVRLTRPARVAVACLFGGGIGNLIDRLLFGSVTDYIHLLLINFPVFNLADIAITLSVLALLYLLASGRLERE